MNYNQYEELERVFKKLRKKLVENLEHSIRLSVQFFSGSNEFFLVDIYKAETTVGIRIYPNNEGVQAFYDLNNPEEKATYDVSDLEYLNIRFVPADKLDFIDKLILSNMKKRINKNNLVIEPFFRGKKRDKYSSKTLFNIEQIAMVLGEILKGEDLKLLNENLLFLLDINSEKYVYNLRTTKSDNFIPAFTYRFKRKDETIINELASKKRSGKKTVLYSTYFENPLNGKYACFFMGYGEAGQPFFNVNCYEYANKNYLDYIWATLLPIFEKDGLPEALVVNDAATYYFLRDTIKGLGIDISYQRSMVYESNYTLNLVLALISFGLNQTEEKDFTAYQYFLKKANLYYRFAVENGYNPVNERLVDDVSELYALIEEENLFVKEDSSELNLVS